MIPKINSRISAIWKRVLCKEYNAGAGFTN